MRRCLPTLLLLAATLAACSPGAGPAQPTPLALQLPSAALPTLPPFPLAATLPPPSPTALPTEVMASATAGPDFSGEQLTLLHVCPRAEPFASAYTGWVDSLEQGLAARNQAGGVLGAELHLLPANTDAAPADLPAELERVLARNPGVLLALLCDPASEAALSESLAEHGLAALGPGVFGGQTLFGLEPDPQRQLDVALEAILADWASLRPAGAGQALRLALLTWPAERSPQWVLSPAPTPTALPTATGTPGPAPQPPDPYLSLVLHSEWQADPYANVFDFVFAAREAQANLIYTNASGFGLAALLNALHDLGVRERFVVVAPAASYNLQLYEYLAEPSRAQGLYLVSAWAWWPEPSSDRFADWGGLYALGALDLAQQAFADVLRQHGAAGLTRANLLRSLRQIDGAKILEGVSTFGGGQAEQLQLWRVGATLGTMEPIYPGE